MRDARVQETLYAKGYPEAVKIKNLGYDHCETILVRLADGNIAVIQENTTDPDIKVEIVTNDLELNKENNNE